MKTFITAFAVSVALMTTAASANMGPLLPEFPTPFPQDGAFDGKGRLSVIVKDK